MVDLYCERLGPGLWAEPINALTNLIFVVAAWAAWRTAERQRVLSLEIWLLLGLIVSIAFGSGLFHTLATSWARILDIVPILLFQLVFIWAYCRRVVGFQIAYASGLVLIYLAVALWARQFGQLLNGSVTYAPALAVLVILGVYHYQTRPAGRSLLLSASVVFMISIVFRTIDSGICPYFPPGTHFLWHLCNGAMLLILMTGLITSIERRQVA